MVDGREIKSTALGAESRFFMATVLKSVRVTESHSAFLYASGAVILRQDSGKFGTLVDEGLAKILGKKVEALFSEGEDLRGAKGKSNPKVAKTPIAVPDKRVDLLAHQLEIMQANQLEMMKMFQAMSVQPQLIGMNK